MFFFFSKPPPLPPTPNTLNSCYSTSPFEPFIATVWQGWGCSPSHRLTHTLAIAVAAAAALGFPPLHLIFGQLLKPLASSVIVWVHQISNPNIFYFTAKTSQSLGKLLTAPVFKRACVRATQTYRQTDGAPASEMSLHNGPDRGCRLFWQSQYKYHYDH